MSHRRCLLLLPLLLTACFSPGAVSKECQAAAREQLAQLNPPAALKEFRQLQSEVHTERSGGKTQRLGLSSGTLSAEQGGQTKQWQYACRVEGGQAELKLSPAGSAPAAPPTPPGSSGTPTFDLGTEGESDL
ncbi:hypothetical protein [Deinococcus sp. Marseille-Q6407]|uniref:hypothetical protein n=1 Tax=Deinococcus sp. Marseille-Q6407 TaxID=2969223 RepID=UPI0021BF1297|nr:hypothetical protein [Deinococcus sp. Marseille-Q6407]